MYLKVQIISYCQVTLWSDPPSLVGASPDMWMTPCLSVCLLQCNRVISQVSVHVAHTIRRRVKELAMENIFTSASYLVDKVMREERERGTPIPEGCNKDALCRMANRHRADRRPKEPKDEADLLDMVVSNTFTQIIILIVSHFSNGYQSY